MAFVIKNDSMWNDGEFDTPGNTEILAREIGKHLWPNFHRAIFGFILMTTEGIFHKDIKHYDDETGMLTLSSRNPSHKDFEISINNITKIFNVIKHGEKAKKNYKMPVKEYKEQKISLSMVEEEENKAYPQRYVDLMKESLKSKDTVIRLLEEKITYLQEKIEKFDERYKNADE